MTSKPKLRMMQAIEIPAFVDAIIDTGCDICACGDNIYTIGDADLSDKEYEIAAPQLREINRKFGDRDYLRREIVAYLRSLGRYIDSPDVEHWTLNLPPP
ncbi:hypothetical protein C8J35_1265 [Rhizobium sp. PP-F2F-G38]|nr:hypothetical protein C8J35_1265 [Rhizobium sp. PP-F2F-G38]TCP81571.1 hypothetical protein C8J31_11217 [Rhizobium sp. PP-CC-2G-626]TCQ05447.1 hypothetical protein C8J34_107178 [Rhizobium sp. PP-F2F-G36]